MDADQVCKKRKYRGKNVPRSRRRNAYIQFTVDETADEATDLNIVGELVPDALAFTTGNNDISNRMMKMWRKVLLNLCGIELSGPLTWLNGNESTEIFKTKKIHILL